MTLTNVAFVVPGAPFGKGRTRVGKVNGHARMFTPANTVKYESLVSLAASQAMAGHAPMTGGMVLEVDAIFPIPPSWPKKKQAMALSNEIHPTCKPDADNCVKSLCDAMNNIVWLDDAQVVRLSMTKRYGDTPQVRVLVAAMEPQG